MGNLTVKESGEMVNIISPNANNITSFKVHFSPKQEGTGDPSPENVREIVGWNSVEGYKCGKNLFDYAHANILDRHIKNDNGVSVSDGGNSYCQIYISVMPNTTYTLSGLSNEKNLTKRVYYYDENKQWISRTNGVVNQTFTITTPSNCRYIQIQSERQEYQDWSTVQVELGNTATKFEPYKYGTVLMDWTDTIGNIYGGYIDLITGELVQTYHCYQITGQEIFTNSGSNWVTAYVSPQGMQASLVKNGFCTHYPYSPYTKDAIGVMYNEHTITFDQRIGDATYWKNFCTEQYNNGTPITLVYEIKTPFTVATLSPTQLSTLKGQNNFWSNADYVEIEYELTETFDIQKAKRKIILNQPHVESTSGTIAKPETDMIGKIKECKIHFMPVQQGDSDPTPDNIVPVTGWTGIDVYQAFVEYPITPIVNTTESYGVKWIVDKDGLMTAYGTPTAFTGANLGEIYVNGDETLYGTVAGSLNNVTFNKPTLLNSNGKNVAYTASDGILQTGLDLSLYSDIKKVRIPIKRSGNVFMSGSCNVIIWKDKKPTISITSIDWTNIAGTIYGGYVDLISGELVQEFKQCKINELSWTYFSDGACFATSKNVPNDILKDKSLLISYIRSNYYTPIDGYGNVSTYANKQDYSISLYTPSDQHRIIIKDSRFTDVNSFLSAMGDTYIWYRLVEPTVTYQLTPQQLTTLRGINNIWSNANGEVEIKYWKH